MSITLDPTKALLELSRPFPAEKIKQKRGQGGRTMSYISHGLVTERLNAVDPSWSSEMIDEHTYKDASGRIHCEGVTIRLTVAGVSRVESGGPQRQDGFVNEIKNAYSDALKRAAMRFGVALEMWESLLDSEYDEDANPDPGSRDGVDAAAFHTKPAPPRPERQVVNGMPVAGADEPATQRQLRYLQAVARENGIDGRALDERSMLEFGVMAVSLSRRDASTLIDRLQSDTPPQTTQRVDPVEVAAHTPPVDPGGIGHGVETAERITPSQINSVWATAKEHGISHEAVKKTYRSEFGVETITELTRDQAATFIDALATAKPTPAAAASAAS